MDEREKLLQEEIIDTGKKLYAQHLLAATAGNLSARINERRIMITATGSALGSLEPKDVLAIDFMNPEEPQNKRLTSEFPLHSLIYKNFPTQRVIHCHPVLTNAYFAVYSDIKALTFETKLYLGKVPVIAQDTPAVTRPEAVIDALRLSNLVVLKNHGVVAIADTFRQSFHLIEMLEEAVKTVAVARLFQKDILDEVDRKLKDELVNEHAQVMFSKEHIQAIVDLVNKDAFIAQKGQELDLTVQLAITMEGGAEVYKFNFEKGRISRLDFDAQAPFVISAPPEVWRQVFLGKLDSFVAVTQGKMKLQGQLGQLSKWYVPFSRLFTLFTQIKIQ
jgi:L-fuculose-phosphate aldolase